MDFRVDSVAEQFANRARQFISDVLAPLEIRLLSEDFSELLPALETARGVAKQEGLWGPQIPQTLGGQGLRFLQFAHVSEALGYSPLGHFALNCQAPDAGNLEILSEFGTHQQQQDWLTPLSKGEIRSCFSMTEPDRPGSNPTWMDTQAREDGDEFVISGRKWFTTSADGAAFAIVMAVTDPHADPHERATLFLVPTDTQGFEIVRNISCMGHEGSGWLSHSEIAYDACRVPKENMIGSRGAGFSIAQARLGPGRIHHCMRWLGICERCFDIMCDYTANRMIRPNEPLASQQIVQAWIAESRAEIDAARLLVLNTAWKIDRLGQKEARADISMIKFFVASVLNHVIDRAIQCCGSKGISDDLLLSFFYRNERAARIYDGPDEVHKIAVARRVLRRRSNTRDSNA